ncbi:hypothetical protein FVA95_26090, partial [Pseudonocardia sp. EV170527-09]
HYHDIGILEPAHIDPDTGYRFYDTGCVGAPYGWPIGPPVMQVLGLGQPTAFEVDPAVVLASRRANPPDGRRPGHRVVAGALPWRGASRTRAAIPGVTA